MPIKQNNISEGCIKEKKKTTKIEREFLQHFYNSDTILPFLQQHLEAAFQLLFPS